MDTMDTPTHDEASAPPAQCERLRTLIAERFGDAYAETVTVAARTDPTPVPLSDTPRAAIAILIAPPYEMSIDSAQRQAHNHVRMLQRAIAMDMVGVSALRREALASALSESALDTLTVFHTQMRAAVPDHPVPDRVALASDLVRALARCYHLDLDDCIP